MSTLLKFLAFFFFLVQANLSFADSCEMTDLASLVKINPKTYEFEGLTEAGIQKLTEIRDALRIRFQSFDNDFLNLGTLHHAATIARLNKSNMFIYGPPGGAKSKVVEWMTKGEKEASFQMQLHQMVTEQAFVGGQDFEKAKLGQYEINTKGSLADFKVAVLDEAEKANPAALSSLLSLLEERKILAGNKVIEAKTETIFAMSNANLPEIFDQFARNGLSTTAPAFLNRFLFKVFSYNWLSEAEDRMHLIEREKKKRKLKAIAQVFTNVLQNEVFFEAPQVDWESLAFLSTIMMTTSEFFDLSYNELFSSLREETNKAISESEINFRERKESFVYFPSCDFNTRNFLRVSSVIQFSAFLDFLLSDLADDLSKFKKAIELGVPSLWRAYLVMTTIGPGKTRLKLDTKESSLDIDFGWNIDISKARDERERNLIANLENEQKRFKEALMSKYAELQREIKLGSKHGVGRAQNQELDFEFLIMKDL